MKTLSSMVVALGLGLCVSSAAFAQTGQPVHIAQTAGTSSPRNAQVAPKTRAQVYHELVHAEQDGQIAYLNSHVYTHR